jgi:hypothetical protein
MKGRLLMLGLKQRGHVSKAKSLINKYVTMQRTSPDALRLFRFG